MNYAPRELAVMPIPLLEQSRFLLTAVWQATRTARSWRPDIFLARSGLTVQMTRAVFRRSGLLVEPRDAKSFAETVCALLQNPLPPIFTCRIAAQSAWPRFGEKHCQAPMDMA
jgi:hypothetical protein